MGGEYWDWKTDIHIETHTLIEKDTDTHRGKHIWTCITLMHADIYRDTHRDTNTYTQT